MPRMSYKRSLLGGSFYRGSAFYRSKRGFTAALPQRCGKEIPFVVHILTYPTRCFYRHFLKNLISGEIHPK